MKGSNRRFQDDYMLIGYARVSTHDQTLNLQKDALLYSGESDGDAVRWEHKQGIYSICPDGGPQAPVAFTPPRP